MKFPALEKFIDTMGLTVDIKVNRKGVSKSWDKFVCVHILVSKGNQVEYSQYHCYSMGPNGLKYAEGNQVKGVRDGILAYLGDDQKVDNYFEDKTRKLAKDFF